MRSIPVGDQLFQFDSSAAVRLKGKGEGRGGGATHSETCSLDEPVREVGPVGLDLVDDFLVKIFADGSVFQFRQGKLLQLGDKEVVLLLLLSSSSSVLYRQLFCLSLNSRGGQTARTRRKARRTGVGSIMNVRPTLLQ